SAGARDHGRAARSSADRRDRGDRRERGGSDGAGRNARTAPARTRRARPSRRRVSWPRAPPTRRRTAGNRPARAAAAPRRCALPAVAGLGPRRPRRDYQYSRADPTTRRHTRQDDAARRGGHRRGARLDLRDRWTYSPAPRSASLRASLADLVTIVAQSQRPALSVPSRPAVEVESDDE